MPRAEELVETGAERASLDALRAATGQTDGTMERHCVRQFLIAPSARLRRSAGRMPA